MILGLRSCSVRHNLVGMETYEMASVTVRIQNEQVMVTAQLPNCSKLIDEYRNDLYSSVYMSYVCMYTFP